MTYVSQPWIIAQNFRHPVKIFFAGVVFGVVFLNRGPFLVHGDCHVSKKANRQEAVFDHFGGGNPDGLAGWGLHLVVHAQRWSQAQYGVESPIVLARLKRICQ